MKLKINSIYDIADFKECRMHESYRVPKTFFCIFPLKENYHYYVWYGGRQEYTLRKGYYVIPVVLVPKRWFCGDFVILYCSKEGKRKKKEAAEYKEYLRLKEKYER